jgi:hypothetical protein
MEEEVAAHEKEQEAGMFDIPAGESPLVAGGADWETLRPRRRMNRGRCEPRTPEPLGLGLDHRFSCPQLSIAQDNKWRNYNPRTKSYTH